MKHTLTALLLSLFITGTPTASADEALLKKCSKIKSDLARLEAKREYGGSARQMDNWKRSMHDKQDEYSRLYCRQFRFELDKR